MNRLCQRSWKRPTDTSWTFCTLDRNHPGICVNSAMGAKPEGARFFEEIPEAQAEIDAQRVAQAKSDARKSRA